MLGAVIGDIVGSIYEWNNIKTKDFVLFEKGCHFTDETVLNFAVANGLMRWFVEQKDCRLTDSSWVVLKKYLTEDMKRLGRLYSGVDYGGMFQRWLQGSILRPYRSGGNGAAMRVAPLAYGAKTLQEAEDLAKLCAYITHDYYEAVKGAMVAAGCVFLSINGATKGEIKNYAQKYYDLSFTLEEIRPYYNYKSSAEGSVPYAIEAFLEAVSFEDALRNAVSIGGDSDTIASITGAIAEGYFGIPEEIKRKGLVYLKNTEFIETYNTFNMIFSKEAKRKIM